MLRIRLRQGALWRISLWVLSRGLRVMRRGLRMHMYVFRFLKDFGGGLWHANEAVI